MDKILDFSKYMPNRPIVEDLRADSLNKSIFANQYEDALMMLNTYLSSLPSASDLNAHSRLVNSLTDSNNNIFAFVGERGSGKTSCMLSLATFLLDDEKRKKLGRYEQVRICPFFHIGMIDPSFFDQEHNVLSLFLAKLYQSYQNWMQQHEPSDYETQSELMDYFCAAQKHLNFMLDKGGKVYDDIDRLLVFSAATDLKGDIGNVIDSYKRLLKYPPEAKLLLLIDDIDLNTGDGSRMAELIRKYFIQPNIVVLISVKVEQLAMVKKQEFVREYQQVLNAGLLEKEQIVEMAERYLTKFVPQQQRIYMPLSENVYEMQLRINTDIEDKRNKQTVKESICGQIFQKTRYLFYNSPFSVSGIVPNNLRELNQLFSLLNELPYYRDGEQENVYNKALFKQYLIEDWVGNHICLKHQTLIKEIFLEGQLSRLNNKVIKLLKDAYPEILKSPAVQPEILYILDEANVVYNLSIGDVLAVLDYLSSRCVTEYDQQLFFFIRSLYSIRLYEAYDIMTDKIDAPEDSASNDVVYAKDDFNHLSEYDKLVGGTYVNTKVTPLLSIKNAQGEDYNCSAWLVSSDKLNELYIECSANWNAAFESGNAQLLELLLLCIYRDGYNEAVSADMYNNKSYRKDLVVVYDHIRENAFYVMDLGALMYNLTRAEGSYRRLSWGEKLWKEAQRNESSLWNKFVKNTNEERGKYCEHTWKSYACVRNVEVLNRFVNHVRQTVWDNTKKHNITSKCPELYKSYFTAAASFDIKTYDFRPIEKDHYTIHFKFYEEIGKILNMNGIGDRFISVQYKQDAQNAQNTDSTTTQSLTQSNEQPMVSEK